MCVKLNVSLINHLLCFSLCSQSTKQTKTNSKTMSKHITRIASCILAIMMMAPVSANATSSSPFAFTMNKDYFNAVPANANLTIAVPGQARAPIYLNEIPANYKKMVLSQQGNSAIVRLATNFEGKVLANYILTSTDGSVWLNGDVNIASGPQDGGLSMEHYPAGNYILTVTVIAKATKAKSIFTYKIQKA
jgi:hypothetical protein